ncbi:Acetyl esterase/lipase [Filimonas lacunae]|uniref:Acetyl esterase/lipase n=1 Tax=Filimonas lacunae TaxID=477680 RepID=A0A173MIC7_9BACT|nr:alpha/beta hydrolase [Filimonas lacunae]BAV07168.1 xylanase [Filimonas lacunae]SIS93909.1 Acetyl esterase/lipase [Filimonas lacunae]
MKKLISFCLVAVLAVKGYAQEFIPLWPAGKMPNSKHMKLTDSIANERVFRVGVPGMYAFFSSESENKRAAVVICPGGGYERLAYIISGTQLAKWFNTLGVSAFVLNYRLPNSADLVERDKGPLQDAERAIKLIRANAARWKIDTARVGVQGSSAGGHLAAMLSTSVEDVAAIGDSLDQVPFHPNFSILVSPVIDMGTYANVGSRNNLLGLKPTAAQIEKYSMQLQVTENTSPAFIVHAFNDKAVSVRNSLLYYGALVENNVSSSIHVFPAGGHSIALRNNPGSTELWTELCEKWLEEIKIIERK